MLTKAQKKLSKEIDEIVELLALNHKDIESKIVHPLRTFHP